MPTKSCTAAGGVQQDSVTYSVYLAGRRAVAGLEQLVNDRDQLFGIDWLFQVQVGEGFSSLESLGDIATDNHDRRSGMRLGGLHNGAAIGVAEAPVGYDRVIGIVFELLDRVVSRSGRRDDVAGSFQDCALQGDDMRFVVDTEYSRHNDSSCPRGAVTNKT